METAPNSNFESQQPEEKMPWTPLDVETAEEMLVISDGYDQKINWVGRMARAARRMGFDGYSDERLSGVREYLSHKGAEARKFAIDNAPIEQSPTKQWFDELASNESMQHGLHPEDEAHIISAIEKST